MRPVGKIPRILNVSEVNGLVISVIFNNGEKRVIDFNQVFNKLRITAESPVHKLRKPAEFRKVQLVNHTLSWNNVDLFITFQDKKIKIPFEIGADVLYKLSNPFTIEEDGIGKLIKAARVKAGLSQDDVAHRSGTTRTYISRLENDNSGIEIGTLKRIVEMGLGRTFNIRIGPPVLRDVATKSTKDIHTDRLVRAYEAAKTSHYAAAKKTLKKSKD